MDNHIIYKEISRLRTSDLLVTKMDCTKRMSLYKSLKHGLIGLMGIFVGQVVKTTFADQAMSMMDYVSILSGLYCVVGYLILDTLEASTAAQKELICDVLALRTSRTGKKKS